MKDLIREFKKLIKENKDLKVIARSRTKALSDYQKLITENKELKRQVKSLVDEHHRVAKLKRY